MRWFSALGFLRSRIVQAPRPLSGVVLGAGCALLVHALFSFGWLDGMERGTLDTLFRARGSKFGAPQVVLVIANDETVARYNTWPLPRRVYAELIRKLSQAKVKTIALDLLFSERSQHPEDDAALITACRVAGNVIQGSAFHVEGLYNPSLPVSATGLEGRFDERFALHDQTGGEESELRSAVWVSASLPALRDTAPLLGHINVHPGRDGALRRTPLTIRYRDKLYPSLALAAAAHYFNVKAKEIEVFSDEVLVAGRRLPVEADGQTVINWTGGNGTFSTYSISQILDGDVPGEALQDKIVLIGATAAGSFEYRATPFSSVQPALEVQANALDNILLNRPLHNVNNWARFLLLFVFTIGAGALIAPRLDMGGTLLLVGLSGVLWGIALWLLARQNLYLPIAPPIIAAAMTYALAMAMNYRQEWEANFRADAAVSALARGGALMTSGHNRGRLQTVIRGTARETLRAHEILMVNEDNDDELLRELMAQICSRRRAVFYPFPRRASTAEKPFAPDEKLCKLLEALSRRTGAANDSLSTLPSIVVAPVTQAQATDREAGRRPHGACGVLIAVGSRETRCFGFRDAILLETLAEQAGLALENLEYYELLQGRVELANRDLREAYGVLTEQSAKFMAAVESIDDALVICDASGHAIFINSGAAPTLREATPQLGEDVPAMLRSHGLDQIAALFDCMQLQGIQSQDKARPDAENELHQNDSSRCEVEIGNDETSEVVRPRVFSAQLTPLYADSDAPIGAMLLIADVTAQRELDRMKTEFVSFVAHELRSPLGAILGYASLLQQYGDKGTPEMREEMTESIVRQCHRLNRLISDLLDISRLDAGRPLDLRSNKVELRGIVDKVLDAQRAAQSNPRVSFRLDCSEAAISIIADADRIEQILVNLVSNAVKYSPEGGEVVVQIEDDNNGATIKVRDPGLGMTPEQVENLFQKYYRTPEARARGIKGTGLGLYLVKNLVDAHRGRIEVESAIGQGTTFSVWIPRGVPQASPSPFLNFDSVETPLQFR
jgi:signal transduction histidine kinase/CHASE2 domain-containing sensor protein